jgi:uncharacterized membrane protein
MITENAVLMQMARESLKGKWGLAIGTFVVYLVISACFQIIPVAGAIASLIVSGPLTLGIVIFSLNISRNKEARLEQLFDGFKNFGIALATYLLMVLFIILWMILLIVPGIIAALSYSLTFYILADDNAVKPMEAIDKSKKMMMGYKWKLFCLGLRFLGWALLCLLTLGIGFLWLMPYMQISMAKFYEDVKGNVGNTVY